MARVGHTSPKLENTLRTKFCSARFASALSNLPHLPSESVFVRLNRRFPEYTVIFQYIEMVEIDGVVMRECAKHMRATAGDSMDNYTGDNYQIFCEDCIPRLASF